MEPAFFLLVSIVVLALAFDYINGFHDAANAVATVVATKVLSPKKAVIYGAILNFIGALLGTKVASTIGQGLVAPEVVTCEILLIALISAISWNLITWYKGLPSSSSHALMGSLFGAVAFASGYEHLQWDGITHKVIIPMFSSPFLGFVIGYFVMIGFYWLLYRVNLTLINSTFRKLQLFSSGYLALMHGANDAQKTMGIIALAVATYYQTPFEVSRWIIISCAIAIGSGTIAGGWRIIRTVSAKMVKIKPLQGFSAEMTAGTIMFLTAQVGIPISTTHTITSAIMGVGSSKRLSALKPKVIGNIVMAWVLTLPVTFLLGGVSYLIYHWLSLLWN